MPAPRSYNVVSGRSADQTPHDLLTNEHGALMTGNVETPFRETFESWPSPEWTETKAPGDIVAVDGNALGASYLAISLSPLTAGTETFVDTVDTFSMPFDLAVGLHLSQNTWGQDCSVEFIDVDEIPAVADMEISAISQTTTTLTVDTVLPHNLVPGKRIGIRGCSNAIVNYPSLVVAAIASPTQFTATGGPNSTIPSQTVTNPAGVKGFVYFRPALSSRRNGTSLHFESSTATLGFTYARASAGDALPFASGSGNALNARQATTVGTTASVPLVASSPYTYSFTPTNEYRLTLLEDRLQWSDALVDSIAASNPRVTRTQVVPNPVKSYRVRLKARNEPSLTVPSAQVVTVSKAGSTTATVVTASPHGLVTGDLVVGYGVRDTGTGFYPALTTPAAVTVVDPTTFTVVWGTSATNTSFGGYIAKVNAACPVPGAVSQSIQSAVKTTLADGQHQVVLVGSATWAGLVIGDEVEVLGARDAVNGLTSIGIDGTWKVANLATTNLTLINVPGSSPTVPDLALVNCGGAVIKRTTMRVSYLRPTEFERQRVEMLPRPSGDAASSVPVSGAVTVSSGTVTAAGTVAVDSAIGNPVTAGLRASSANITAMSAAGDSVGWMGTMIGAGIVKPYALPEAGFNASLALTSTTAAPIQTAGAAGIKRHLTAVQAINTGAAAVDLILLDGATERWRLPLPVNIPVAFEFPTELTTTAATALNANLSAAGTVRANFQGYTAP
jgi:hypothetical protein